MPLRVGSQRLRYPPNGRAISGYGSSPTRFSFAATRLRFPTVGISMGTNHFGAVDFRFGTPDYDVTNPRFAIASFWSPTPTTANEFPAGGSISIEGLSVLVGATWVLVPGISAASPLVIDPSTSPGELLPAVPVTLTKNTLYRARITFFVNADAITIPSGGSNSVTERRQGSTTSLASRLTDGVALSNSGGAFFTPAFMVAQGGDGRPVCIALGDSIGYGVTESGIGSLWDQARHVYGFIERGLDDNLSSKRIACGNFCIPGTSMFGAQGWSTRSNWSGKLDLLRKVYTQCGAWPFDEVLNEHGTNNIGAYTLTAVKAFYTILVGEWGTKPVTQIELLPQATSTNQWADLAGQSAAASDTYSPTKGARWIMNEDAGGANGLGDSTSALRSGGYIIGSFAPWRVAAYDTGTNRDKLLPRSFATTVASAYASGGSIILTAAPTVGADISIAKDAGGFFTAIVTAVTGSGPYTVSITAQEATAAASAGNSVREIPHDLVGLHPSPLSHQLYAQQSVVPWKQGRGWV